MCSLCEVRDEPPATLDAERLQELYDDHMEEVERIIRSAATSGGRIFQPATLDDIAQNVHTRLVRMANDGQEIRRSWRALVWKMAVNKAIDQLRAQYREALCPSMETVEGSGDPRMRRDRDDELQAGFLEAESRAMLQREAAEVLAAHGISYPSPGEILELMDELVLRVVNRTMLRRQAVVLFELVLGDLFPADLVTGDDLQPEYFRWLFTVGLWPQTARREPETAAATYRRTRQRGIDNWWKDRRGRP